MPCGMRVGLGPGDSVLDGDPALLSQKGGLSAHVHGGQTAGCIKMALDMEVGLGTGHIVLDGDPAPLPKKGTLQTDDRQTTDGRAIAYSEREREFTFAKNRMPVISEAWFYVATYGQLHMYRVSRVFHFLTEIWDGRCWYQKSWHFLILFQFQSENRNKYSRWPVMKSYLVPFELHGAQKYRILGCFRTWKTPCTEIGTFFTGVRMRKAIHVCCFKMVEIGAR